MTPDQLERLDLVDPGMSSKSAKTSGFTVKSDFGEPLDPPKSSLAQAPPISSPRAPQGVPKGFKERIEEAQKEPNPGG